MSSAPSNYELYLFSCLIKLYDKNFEKQPYDIQFDLLPTYYHHFELSIFNADDKSLYDCIVDYCNHHFPNN